MPKRRLGRELHRLAVAASALSLGHRMVFLGCLLGCGGGSPGDGGGTTGTEGGASEGVDAGPSPSGSTTATPDTTSAPEDSTTSSSSGGPTDDSADSDGSSGDSSSSGGLDCSVIDRNTTFDDATALSWVTRITGRWEQELNGIVVRDDGTLVVNGFGADPEIVFADGQTSEVSWSHDELEPVFVAALEPDGELAWAYVVETTLPSWWWHTDLALRSDQSVVFGAGLFGFEPEATFRWPDASTTTLIGEAAFVARLSDNGDLLDLLEVSAQSLRTIRTGPDDAIIAGGRAADEGLIVKWEADGSPAWNMRLTQGAGDDTVAGLDVTSDGSILAVGRYGRSNVTTSFGDGEAQQTMDSQGGADGFLTKVDADGVLQWVRGFGGNDGDDAGTHVRVLPDDSIAVAGYFRSSAAVFGEGESSETTLAEAGARTAFVARFTGDGNLIWVRSLGGEDFYEPNDLEVTPTGDIAVLIDTAWEETATIDVSAECTWPLPAAGDMHVLVFDEDGTLQWSRHDPWDGSIHDSRGGGIAFAESAAYLAGSFHDATFGLDEVGEVSFETHNRDAAVAAFTY